MRSLREIFNEILSAPRRIKSDAEYQTKQATAAAAWLSRNIKENVMGVDAEFSYYSSTLRVFAPMPTDARRLMKSFGGKWDKKFNELTGKFDFIRTELVDEKTVIVTVNPSKTCKIEMVEVEETSTYKRKKFIPRGDCGSILEDDSK